MKTHSKILIVAGLVVLIPALLLAQAAEKRLRHDPQVVRYIIRELDLTPDQIQKVRTLVADHKSELKSEIAAIQSSRSQLFDAVHADAVDEAAIKSAAASVGKAEADLALTRARLMSAIRQDLTPEQQEKAKALLAKARARRDRFFSRLESHLDNPLSGI